MKYLKFILPALVILGAGGFAGYYFFLREKPVRAAVKPSAAVARESIPVPAVSFTDITKQAKIAFKHENGLSGRKLLPETMGGGVAAIDVDGDGLQDLVFINSCPWPGHSGRDATATPKLYRNKGDGSFDDVTVAYGLNITMYGMGVAVGDFDNDGFPDLFISCVGKHRLFHNDGGKKFTEVTDAANISGGVPLPKCSWDDFLKWDQPIPFGSSATFVDYDGDGKLDLFVCHYLTWSPKYDLNVSSTLQGGKRAFVAPSEFDGAQCVMYRNIDGKRFEDVSKAIGLPVVQPDGTGPNARIRPLAKSLGVVVCDPDEDGWLDLVVANDKVRNFFYHNIAGPNGTRVYEEIGERIAVAYADEGRPRAGMGIDWGEYAPGKSAILITNFANESNTFLKLSNPKQLNFSDAALAYGLAGTSRQLLKFGAMYFDFDLDGRLDLLTCNGHIEPDIATIQTGQTFEQPVQLFWNTGDIQRLFEPAQAKECGADLFKPMVGRGCAYVDFDGDGDLDVVLVSNNGPATLLRNDNKLGHTWARFTLEGDGKKSNRSAIGAEVTIEAGGKTYKRCVAGARGYLSQSEFPITIGLGDVKKIDKVTVRWPGRDAGPPQVWTGLDAGRAYKLKQGDTQAAAK